jgi:hypothetical protein
MSRVAWTKSQELGKRGRDKGALETVSFYDIECHWWLYCQENDACPRFVDPSFR